MFSSTSINGVAKSSKKILGNGTHYAEHLVAQSGELIDAAADLAEHSLNLAREQSKVVRKRALSLAKTSRKAIQRKPLVAVMAALGVGVAVTGFLGLVVSSVRARSH